jgi:hypothetical protein
MMHLILTGLVHVPIVDIMIEAVVKEDSILRNNSETFADSLLSVVTNIISAKKNFARQRVIESEEQTGDCGLSTAAMTNNGYGTLEEDEGTEETMSER